FDQTIRLTGQQTRKKYPSLLRRIVYYSTEYNRSFTYLTNSFEVKAEHIALLYKNRWQVELFFYGKHIVMQSVQHHLLKVA
ncbi:MAG: transposase, partial [Bacteroidales bacterium]|nr:transposase [Bacteroidales bacterium]